MANKLQIKRGLVAGIPTGSAGEPLFTTDTNDLYIGTGSANIRFQKYIASGATTQILLGDGSLYNFPLAISSPSNGQYLTFNGTSWVNTTLSGTGITTLNTLTATTQTFVTGTSGTDFNISSATSTHTFNLPTASGTNRGALSSGDWTNFTAAYNDKINSAAVTGTTTKTLTLTQQDGGTITASWTDIDTSGITSLNGLTAATQTFANDTNVTITSATSTHTIGWSGTLAISRGGTGASTTVAAFDNLSPLTTLGDTIFHNGTDNVRLAGNTTTAKQFLSQTGTGTVSAAPSWATITGSDITGAALTKTDDTNVTLTLGGTPTTALLRAASLTLGWTGQLAVGRGGTGASTLTGVLLGNGTSAFTAITGTASQYLRRNSGNTAYEFGAIGGGDVTGAALTKTDDTNVTLTLGGTPTTALLRAASLTLGWSGQLSIARGGTGLSALGTANQLLRVNAGATALEYFTPTYTTGTGTSGQVAYWNGTSSITGESALYWDATNDRLGINKSNPAFSLDVSGIIYSNDEIVAASAITSNYGFYVNRAGSDTFSSGAYLQLSSIGILQANASNGIDLWINDTTWQRKITVATSGATTITNLAGTGTRMVVADANGLLSTQAVPSGTVTGSGTTNYIPKWTSSSALGNSVIYESGGNIGINETSPYSKLDIVQGTVGYGGWKYGISLNATDYPALRLLATTGNTGSIIAHELGSTVFLTGTTSTTAGAERMRITSGGNLLVGTSVDSGEKLVVSGRVKASASDFHSFIVDQGSAQIKLERTTTSTGSMYIGADNVGFKVFDSSFNTRLTLTNDGNLGLSVTPSAWGSNFRALQLYGVGLYSVLDNISNTGFVTNSYWDTTDNRWEYVGSGHATNYQQFNGQHIWYNAPSGTANTAITFTQAMTLDASGRLGIATNPVTALSVYSNDASPSLSSDVGIATFHSSSSVQLQMGAIAASPYTFWLQTKQSTNSGASFPLALNPLGGNVLIGTTTDGGYKLDVAGNARATSYYSNSQELISSDGTSNYLKTAATLYIQTGSTTVATISNTGAATFSSSVTANGQVRIAAGGSFTTLTNSQGLAFDDVASDSGIEFLAATSGNGYGHRIVSIDSGSGAGILKIQSRDNSTTWSDTMSFRLGNVGIGTSSPDGTLVVSAGTNGTASTGGYIGFTTGVNNSKVRGAAIETFTTGTGNDHGLRFYTNDAATAPAERMRITSGGNVGIGTISPAVKLDVVGEIRSTSTSGYAALVSSSALGFSILADTHTSGAMTIWTDGSEKARIKSTGQLQLNNYQSTTSFSGTVVGYLAFDASGNILTTASAGGGGVTGSGTTNYLPKWTSSSALGNSLLQEGTNAIGLGVTPSAWSLGKSMQIGSTTSFFNDGSGNTYLGNNFYYNSAFLYTTTANAVSYVQTSTGEHRWNTAPSGTAGNAITFTQAMTLDANGKLMIGTTTSGRKLTVFDSTIDNHILVAGTAPSVAMTDTVTGATYQAKFGLATASNNFATGSVAGDFVISCQTGAIIWALNSVQKMQLKTTSQLQLHGYTSSSSFSGTAAGYLAFDSSGNVITVAVPSSGGITTLNTLTAATQTFAVGTSGTDFNISSATSTHTFNIPDASGSARGLVTTGTQTFAGVKTFSSKIVDTRIDPRSITTTSTSTLTPDVSADDVFTVTAQAATITLANPTGTPVEGQKIIVRIKDNGTARSIQYGTQYRGSSDLALPTTTTISRTIYLGFIYNSTDTKWDLLARLDNFA